MLTVPQHCHCSNKDKPTSSSFSRELTDENMVNVVKP